jgi:hypothetical protein
MKRFWGIAALIGALLGSAAQAQNVYPPSNILRVGSQLTFELRQQWTGTVTGKDSDGDWQGNARAANGTQGQFVGFPEPNSSTYAFQVGTTASSEYCVFNSANSVVNNAGGVVVYAGSRFSQQGNAQAVNDNATCRVTVSNGGGGTVPQPTQPIQPPSQPTQPPSLPGTQAQLPPLTFPPRLEVGQRWEFRLGNRAIVYRTALLAQENRSGTAVYTGTLVTDGAGDPVASRKLEMFFSQDTLATYATDPQGGVTVCSFQGAASLQNNVLTGTVFFRAPGQSQFSTLTAPTDAPCRANLEPIQGAAVQPTQPNPPPATQTFTASLPAQVGDTWQISATGYQPWVLNLTKLDDGDPAGTATQGNARGDAFAIKGNDGSHAFLMGIGGRNFYCFIQPNTRFQGNSILGGLGELIGSGNNAQAQNLNTPCTATLTARGGNTGGSTQPLAPTLTASFPPKPGQTWTLTIDGLAPWTMVFDRTNQDGVSGRATQNGVSSNAFAFVDGNENWFQVSGNGLVYFCIFPARPQVSGSSLVGGTAFSAPDPNAQLTRLNRACTATLTSQTLLSLYKSGFERQKMPIKRSPLF